MKNNLTGRFISGVDSLAGKRFGRWLVLDEYVTKKKRLGTRIDWKCKCDCGTEAYIEAGTLKNGRSSGCRKCRTVRRRLPYGEMSKRQLYRHYKRNSHSGNRHYDFTLTLEQFSILTKQDCYYCGQPPSMEVGKDKYAKYGVYIYNGIDRVDNTRGYSIDNCVACCKQCNWAKRELPQQEFIDWIHRVSRHLNGG